MEMIDTESGEIVGNVPIGNGADGCAFDEAEHLVFAPCGEGVTVIAKEKAPNELSLAQQLKTERGARTIALDPQTHRIYLPTAHLGPAASSGGRPSIVPNTMKLLVTEQVNSDSFEGAENELLTDERAVPTADGALNCFSS